MFGEPWRKQRFIYRLTAGQEAFSDIFSTLLLLGLFSLENILIYN